MSGAALWSSLIAAFGPAFNQPSFAIFTTLIEGWIACPGRRTITRVISVADPDSNRAHDAYHRFIRCGAWSMDVLWKCLAHQLVTRLVPSGDIYIDLDDTLYHKSGSNVDGAGNFRDAVRSTKKKVVYALGLNLVVVTPRIYPPWGGMPLGLPIGMRLHRKGGTTTTDLADALVRKIADWFCDRQIRLCCDGAYATLAGRGIPRSHVTSRMQRNAALYEAPPPRTGRKGRPPVKGARLPRPDEIAPQSKRAWKRATINERGRLVERLLWSRAVLWHSVLPDKMVLLVVVRDPEGIQRDDYFFTTDLAMKPADVVHQYAGRWSIEETFRNTKQFLGGEGPQSWVGEGPERAAALSLWLSSVVWLWYIETHGKRPTWIAAPWYTFKRAPSFYDALTSLRELHWTSRIYGISKQHNESSKIIDLIVRVLASAA